MINYWFSYAILIWIVISTANSKTGNVATKMFPVCLELCSTPQHLLETGGCHTLKTVLRDLELTRKRQLTVIKAILTAVSIASAGTFRSLPL